MSYDASAQSLRCPFCGNEKLDEQKNARVLRPEHVVPFAIREEDALARMRQWMGSSFWRPGDLARASQVTKMAAVYVPYWVFAARTCTYWTADTSQTPMGARGDWCPLSGQHHGSYEGLLIGASSALSPAETSAICPFDLSHGVPPEQVDLENSVFEQFRVQRKYARPLARQGLEALDRGACAQYVPGRSRNVKVNVRLEDLRSEPVLLPVWIMAYRYQDKLFRFLVNGQTGKVTGQAPVSWRKISAVAAIVIAVIVVVVLLMLAAGGLMSLVGRTLPASSFDSVTSNRMSPLANPHRACLACLGGSLPDRYRASRTIRRFPTELASVARCLAATAANLPVAICSASRQQATETSSVGFYEIRSARRSCQAACHRDELDELGGDRLS
jgi:hypothetical protein